MPHVPMLALNNARQGFLERHELGAILEHVPAYLHAPLIFAFTTGLRIHAEVMPLRVEQLDMAVGVVRLEPGVTKNKEGRSFYLTKELRTVLEGQEESIAGLRKQGVICPYVFHRPNGSQIKNFRTHRWQPFSWGGPARSNPLWLLQSLNNIDKHRFVRHHLCAPVLCDKPAAAQGRARLVYGGHQARVCDG